MTMPAGSNENPWLNRRFDQAADAVQGRMGNAAAGMGLTNTGVQQAYGRQMNDLAGNIYGGAYEADAGRRQQTAMQQSQQAFTGTESALDRTQRAAMQQAGFGQEQAMQAGAQNFTGAQAELDRTQRAAMQQAGFGHARGMLGDTQDFAGTQAGLDRTQRAAMQQAGFGQEQAMQTGAQNFTGAQAGLDRTQRAAMQQAGFGQEQAMQAGAQAFTGTESALARGQRGAMQQAGFGHERGMLGDTQDFAGTQSALGRGQERYIQEQGIASREGMQGADITSREGMQQAGFGHEFGMLGSQQQFAGDQAAMNRAQETGMLNTNLGFQGIQNQAGRNLQGNIAEMNAVNQFNSQGLDRQAAMLQGAPAYMQGMANYQLGLGDAQQGQAQAQIDANMAQWNAAQQQPYNNIGMLGGVVPIGLGAGGTSTGVQGPGLTPQGMVGGQYAPQYAGFNTQQPTAAALSAQYLPSSNWQ